MDRNANSHFAMLPDVNIGRSKFKRPSTHKTTMNAGELVPIYVDEVLPGDTFTMDMASLVRMTTPIFPVMDNAYMDTYFFFVPNRIVWNHWKEFNGENKTSFWAENVEYNVPVLNFTSGADKGSIADYMGIPTEVPNTNGINALPFRAYVAIWNEFFRDQNTMQPAFMPYGDTAYEGSRRGEAGDSIPYESAFAGGKPLPVCKYHDYFTSCLPSPQKGEPVQIPLFDADFIPVTTTSNGRIDSRYYPALAYGPSMGSVLDSELDAHNGLLPLYVSNGSQGSTLTGYNAASVEQPDIVEAVSTLTPVNLGLDTTGFAVGTINQLRQAFQIQRLLERDARSGTRYTEVLQAHFGVTNPDSRMQRPEYLGGKRIPINIDQVLQTSATNEVSPQGNTSAYSLTTDVSSVFTKSFTEHGTLICVACIRTDHTYQQSLDRMWSRSRRFDFYWPALANLGEQAVLKKELYLTGTPADDEAFGYQEAWAEYRYKPNRISGAFRSNYPGTLDSWHYADYYDQDPETFVLQADWLIETPVNIDRTLAVQSDFEDQFLCDFAFNLECYRPMPLYSVPGLIDHN